MYRGRTQKMNDQIEMKQEILLSWLTSSTYCQQDAVGSRMELFTSCDAPITAIDKVFARFADDRQ
jgi:hypothetical protein